MRKLFIMLGAVIIISCTANPQKHLQGTWTNGHVEYTFDKDTLYIDEIGIEGNIYTYTIDERTIKAVEFDSPFNSNDTLEIEIKRLHNNELRVRVLGDEITFVRHNKIP